MEQQENDKILAFDSLFTTNQIQIFKIMLSYLNPAIQKNLAVYIKLMELQYTLSFFQKYPHAAVNRDPGDISQNSAAFFDEILPLCDNTQRNKIKQFKQTMQSVEQMQEMMSMLEMMKELFPQGTNTAEETTGDDGTKNPNNKNGLENIDISQLLNMLSGGNMPDLSGLSDIMNLFK